MRKLFFFFFRQIIPVLPYHAPPWSTLMAHAPKYLHRSVSGAISHVDADMQPKVSANAADAAFQF